MNRLSKWRPMNRLCNRSSIGSAKPMIGCENRADCQTGNGQNVDVARDGRRFVVSQTERDVSVRQRAVDLLYAMCDRSNAEEIVSQMLAYLETADYSIREEMVCCGAKTADLSFIFSVKKKILTSL